MYTLVYLPSFQRDLEKYRRKARALSRLEQALEFLRAGTEIPHSYRDHQLQGKLHRYRELHVEGDWLLVYHRDGKQLIIECLWLVSHQKLRERERSV